MSQINNQSDDNGEKESENRKVEENQQGKKNLEKQWTYKSGEQTSNIQSDREKQKKEDDVSYTAHAIIQDLNLKNRSTQSSDF